MVRKYGAIAKAAMIAFALAFALMSLTPRVVRAAQTSPEGFCQSYLLLGELSQPGGANPALADRRLDYLTDGAGVTQNNLIPADGTTVNTNFSVAASTAWQGTPNNIFAPTITGDTADFSNIYGALDDLMTYAWTYIDNSTGSALDTNLGVAADDGSLVVLNGTEVGETTGWHNNRLVDELIPITLLPGKNLLMVKVFEGGGGHNLRVRCQSSTLTGDVTGDPGQAGVTYSTDPTGYAYPEIAVGTRTLPANGLYGAGLTMSVTVTVNKSRGNPNPTVTETVPAGWTVGTITTSQGSASAAGQTITWNVNAMGGASATMTYDVTPAGTGPVTFTGASAMTTTSHGPVSLTTGGDTQLTDSEQSQTDLGFAQEWILLGEYSQGGGAQPGIANMRLDYLTDGAGTTEASFFGALPSVGQVINTAFGGAAASTGYNSGNLGFGVPTTFLHMDSDDGVDCLAIFGALDNLMTYGWVIARNKTAAPLPVYLAAASDDTYVLNMNGAEVGFYDGAGRGWGGANSTQEAWPVTLNVGDNIVMIKVFEGGGGHGFRLRLQTDNVTGAASAGNTVPSDQAELLVTTTSYAFASRTLQAAQGYYVPGETVQVTVNVNRGKGVPQPVVTETAPAGWTPTVTTTTLGSASVAGSVITWNLGAMVVGNASMTYELVAPGTATGNQTFSGTIVSTPNNFAITGDSVLFGPTPIAGDPLFDWDGDIGVDPVGQPGGNPSIPGSAQLAGTLYTLTGAGADFWGNVDRGHFLGKKETGGFFIEGTVGWVDPGVNNWSKAVLMWRNSVDGQSAMAMEGIRNFNNSTATPSADTIMQWRDTDATNAAGDGYPPSPEPALVRLVRCGSAAKGFWWDATASAWVEHDRIVLTGVDPYADVVVGLGITSHQDNGSGVDDGTNTDYATAVFDGVSITPIAIGAAVRTFSSLTYRVGQPLTVTIDLVHQADVNPLVVEETLPPGWGAINISDGGTLAGNVITWNLNFQADMQVTYELWPAGGLSQSGTISGIVVDPTVGDIPISGESTVTNVGGGGGGASLVAWWPLDEGTGTTAADIVGGHDGTLFLGATWTPGLFGQAIRFDGVDGYVQCPAGDYLNARAGTIATWMWSNVATYNDAGHMIYGTETTGDGFGGQEEIHLNMAEDGNSGRFQFFTEGDSIGAGDVNFMSPASTLYNNGVWHHVVVTWINTGQCIMYVNGVQVASAAHNGTIFDCVGDIVFGHPENKGHARKYNGLLDDIRFYDGPLTAQQVFDLYITPPDPGSATAPAAPSNLTSTLITGNNVRLTWTDNGTNTDGFIIQRMDATNGVWLDVAQTLGASYFDTNLPLNETFTYRVRAFNVFGESGHSNTTSETTVLVLRTQGWQLYR